MKYSQILASAALAAVANAHATVWNMYVNDVNQGVGNSASGYIRSPPNNSPVKDITSKDMTCNVNNSPAAKTVPVAAGDKITIEWHHDSNSASDDIIAASHQGPVMVYIAPTASNGAGDVWIKLAEEGYDGAKWAVDKLIANKGKHSFTLPSVLAPGNYLIRPEIIAHHESDTAYNVNPARGAQFYMECIQVKVTGSGTTELPTGVAIPGVYTYSDPGVVFNIYGSFTSYKIPGPAVWNPSKASTPTTSKAAAATTSKAAVTTSKAAVTTSKAAVTTSKAAATTTKAAVPTTTSNAPVVTTTKAVATTAKPATTKASVTTTKKPSCPLQTTLTVIVKPSATPVGTVGKWGQCGGKEFRGSTACAAGSTCKFQNPYYSQCL